jgi:hypothetical protein
VEIDVAGGAFTTPAFTFTKEQIIKDGTRVPSPEDVTEELFDSTSIPVGEMVEFELRLRNTTAADIATLRADSRAGTMRAFRFWSDDGGSGSGGRAQMTLANVRIQSVNTSPINEFGKHGFVRIVCKATAAGSDAVMTVTLT